VIGWEEWYFLGHSPSFSQIIKLNKTKKFDKLGRRRKGWARENTVCLRLYSYLYPPSS